MMKFASPYLLNILWGLIPLAGIMVYGMFKRKKILSLFAGDNMLSSLIPGFDPNRRWIKGLLILSASGLAIVALARPQLGYRWEKTTEKGVDIMIALDCSKSMLAQDIKPSRLERAKREIIDLMRMMKSDRAGLVAFSGRAILQCPLTLDHEAFNIFLKVLEPDFLPVGGTNINAAIQECYNGFEKDSDTQKAIIIITDGEDTSGKDDEAAKKMDKQGIKIFCIGVGDLEGAPIPDGKGGFKKDISGNIILSRVDEKALEKLAAMTGGIYVRSVAGDMDLDMIYTDKILGTMERKTLTSGKKKVWENRYQWFLFPGLVLLLMEFLMSSRKKVKKMFIFVFALGLVFLTAQGDPAWAQTVSNSVKQGIKAFENQKYDLSKKYFIDAQLADPENKNLYYNIGAAAYMNKEYAQAKKNFMQAVKTEDVTLKHDAQYNLANTDYRLGNLDEAIKGYEDILKEFPGDEQAKENLKFVKQKKKERQKKKKSRSDKNKNKEKKDKQKNKKDPNRKTQDNKGQKEKSEQDKNKPGKQNQQPNDQPGSTESVPQKKQEPAGLKDKGKDPAKRISENKLNRLEDKPGKAMMPVLQEQHIEKDW